MQGILQRLGDGKDFFAEKAEIRVEVKKKLSVKPRVSSLNCDCGWVTEVSHLNLLIQFTLFACQMSRISDKIFSTPIVKVKSYKTIGRVLRLLGYEFAPIGQTAWLKNLQGIIREFGPFFKGDNMENLKTAKHQAQREWMITGCCSIMTGVGLWSDFMCSRWLQVSENTFTVGASGGTRRVERVGQTASG